MARKGEWRWRGRDRSEVPNGIGLSGELFGHVPIRVAWRVVPFSAGVDHALRTLFLRRFQQVPDFPSAHVEIQPSHEDFTTVPVGQSFEIMVRYKRKCEAYRGLGHVLAITRQLDSPWANPTSDTPHSSDAGASPSVDAQAPGQNSNSNGDPTRSDGADVPPVPSPSSSSSLQQQQTSSSTSLIGSSSSTSEGMEESPQIVDGANQSDGPGVPAGGAEANSTSAGRKWTGNVGHSLRREEDCLFETLG